MLIRITARSFGAEREDRSGLRGANSSVKFTFNHDPDSDSSPAGARHQKRRGRKRGCRKFVSSSPRLAFLTCPISTATSVECPTTRLCRVTGSLGTTSWPPQFLSYPNLHKKYMRWAVDAYRALKPAWRAAPQFLVP